MPTIGQKLGDTRREKGLSVADVAHETRIHPNMILSIEEDDFSQFPSVAYAKSFIRKYSNHLGVDLSAAMAALNSGTTIRLADNELMDEMKKTIKKDRRFRLERRPKGPRRRVEKPGGAPLFLNFILFLLMASLGVFYFLGYNATSIEEAKSEITGGLGKANPFSGSKGGAAGETKAATPANPAMQDPVVLAGTANSGPKPPPVYPVLKPAVEVQFDDALTASPPSGAAADAIPQNPLRPRDTPRMVIAEEPVKPLGNDDLPAVKKPGVEPQAVLRPEGTDPAATRKQNTPSRPETQATGETPPGNMPPPQVPLRAVPVAASE